MTRTKRVLLAPRLRAIAELVPPGDRLCDVGCDHAHIPLYLLKVGRIRSALAMDVIPGPLQKAAENLELYASEEEKDRIELRLSDGLDAFEPGEAQILVIAGMGGRLMTDILSREPEKTRSFSSLVLQPQSDHGQVRKALRGLGYVIEDERMTVQDGKFYQALRAVPAVPEGGPEEAKRPSWPLSVPPETALSCEDSFGPVLLSRRDPILHAFLYRRKRAVKRILDTLKEGSRTETGREKYLVMAGEKELIDTALSLY